MATPLLGRGFVAAVNHLLARSQWARARLQAFAGQHFRIDANPLQIDAGIADDGLLASSSADIAPDVILTLPFAEAPSILAEGMDRLMNRVRISGNAEFAEALGFVFRNLSWDAEEDLSRFVGDIPAHRIVTGSRALAAAQARAVEGLGGNLAEYLTEESGMVTSRHELEDFGHEVTQLRDAVARLDKRIGRLRRRD
jgi:ubiquinone biosynthesis protein UbiJ